MNFLKLLFILFSVLCCANGAKILTIFHAAYSHFSIGNRLAKELATRGHEVTMIASFEQNPPIKNYKTILLKDMKKYFECKYDILHYVSTD